MDWITGSTPALISDEALAAELRELQVEAMGWLPLTTQAGEHVEQAYLHVGDPSATVIHVVGVPDATMAGVHVLWVG